MSSIRFRIQKPSNEEQKKKDLVEEQAEITYKGEEMYTGDVNGGKREGEGKYEFKNGDVYEGAFEDGEMNGKGKYLFDNGDEYEGTFLNGNAHGYGTYVWLLDENLASYKGFFHENTASGKGTLEMREGDTYEGEFLDGIFHGKGIMKFSNGDVFEGRYANGKPSGKGKMLFGEAKLVMNRSFNDNGIDRANTNELKRQTFSLTKKKKKNVIVKKNTFRPKAGRNPNRDIMDDILGSIGIGGSKVKPSVKRKTLGRRKRVPWTQKMRTKKKVTSVISNVNNVRVEAVRTVRAPRRKPNCYKNMDSFKDGSYLEYKRTNFCGTSKRKREGLKLEDIFDSDAPIRRTKSILQSFEAAKKILGYEKRILEEEADEEETAGMMIEEETGDNEAIPSDFPKIELTQLIHSDSINPQNSSFQLITNISRVSSSIGINAAA